jgi:hypothetical protein
MTSATSPGLPEPVTIWVQETCMVQHWGARLLDHPDSRITMVRLGKGADRPSMCHGVAGDTGDQVAGGPRLQGSA